MTSVWKFEIQVADTFTVDMPEHADIISVDVQGGVPFMWALVDPANKPAPRTFHVHGTGHPVKPGRAYRGSFMLAGGEFVGHLFEGLS